MRSDWSVQTLHCLVYCVYVVIWFVPFNEKEADRHIQVGKHTFLLSFEFERDHHHFSYSDEFDAFQECAHHHSLYGTGSSVRLPIPLFKPVKVHPNFIRSLWNLYMDALFTIKILIYQFYTTINFVESNSNKCTFMTESC